MRKVPIWVAMIAMFVVGAVFMSCATMQTIPPKDPVIKLEMIEIPQYFGFWVVPKDAKLAQGKIEKDMSSPLPVAFILSIENPNSEPIMLENIKFSVSFEEFEVNTVMASETQWIPAGKTNELRLIAMQSPNAVAGALLLPGAMKLKKRGVTHWQLIEKWWAEAPNMSFPISVTEGAATFEIGGKTVVVPFGGTFGG